MNDFKFMERVALSTFNLLTQNKAMIRETGKVFFVWQRGERIIVAFDPDEIRLDRVNDKFAHDLSARLQGRRVVRTNSRGIFLQVGLETPSLPALLDGSVPLDLSQQPAPWHLPVGITTEGPLWVSMVSGISFLIGGSTGMGKTSLEHAWIQALLHGGKTEIYAWDGKGSIEFIRYTSNPRFHLVLHEREFDELQKLFKARQDRLLSKGHVNIWDYNEQYPAEPILPLVLFVDEAAFLPAKAKTVLQDMIGINRYLGLYPVVCTNQPTQQEMFGKTNLVTRLAFRVPQFGNSNAILNAKGAESLPGRGRGLIRWNGRLVEFQTFLVTLPAVTDEQRRLLVARVATETETEQTAESEQPNEIVRMAESIRDQWSPGMTKSAVSRLFGKSLTGTVWCDKVSAVVAYLSSTSTSTSTSEKQPTGSQFGATQPEGEVEKVKPEEKSE
jgi:hypothetical protein